MTIKLACCSDTHGQAPPSIDEADVIAWLHAGDVYEEAAPSSAVQTWLSKRTIPVYAVRGNHDYDDPEHFFDRCQDITGAVRDIVPGLLMAGIGWHGEGYSGLPEEIELERVCASIRWQLWRKSKRSDRLILLSHYPADVRELFTPAAPGNGWIYRCIRELIVELQPILVVQGHVHQWFGTAAMFEHETGECLIANPGPNGMVVTLDLSTGAASSAGAEHI